MHSNFWYFLIATIIEDIFLQCFQLTYVYGNKPVKLVIKIPHGKTQPLIKGSETTVSKSLLLTEAPFQEPDMLYVFFCFVLHYSMLTLGFTLHFSH